MLENEIDKKLKEDTALEREHVGDSVSESQPVRVAAL